ncbi:hypothetical protein XA68_14153 [Ophiocordyceps unilateralis]|uniref:Uncharacterized protein n=1 Tax=Ophiocordyceps unilateralis TaxID=268505 RepID=A0A2A9PA61_OPHUN|nr:hypothetical protein XA68_14153 [Ophiocordyceps unilateralis]
MLRFRYNSGLSLTLRPRMVTKNFTANHNRSRLFAGSCHARSQKPNGTKEEEDGGESTQQAQTESFISMADYFSRMHKRSQQHPKDEVLEHWSMAMAGRLQHLHNFIHSRSPSAERKVRSTNAQGKESENTQLIQSLLKEHSIPLNLLPRRASPSTPKKGVTSSIKRAAPSSPKLKITIKKKPAASNSDEQAKTKAKPTRKKREAVNVEVLEAKQIQFDPIHGRCSKKISELSYNLDRVLFNQGVYHMQDERTGVFNFHPYLASIMPREEFDFDALGDYITSSKDVKLREMAAEYGMKYCGSTSSLSAILSQFHFLLSAWRPVSYKVLSQSLKPESWNFTTFTRAPAAAFARYKDGVYAIDADKEYDVESILSMLGKSMEKLLTLPTEEFEKYRRTKSHQISEEERNAGEAYHYATIRNFLVRSQLDAQDKRLPGTGVFDLKTRAVISIRMDVQGYEKGLGYEIRKRFGDWESFEREYYDMIRSAFLKYSLQVRMGRMDGIFVAFHNTERIFGFQYISLPEMDLAIHGTDDVRLGDQEFRLSFGLFNELLQRATNRFPNQSLRFIVETRDTKVPLTYFFAEPVTEEEADKIQEASRPSVKQLENEMNCGLEASETKVDNEGSQTEQLALESSRTKAEANDPRSDDAWKELMARVDDIIENDSLGKGSVRDAVMEALENCGLSQALTEREDSRYLDHLVTAVTAHLTKSEETERSTESEESIKGQETEESSEMDESIKSEETERSIEPEEPIKSQEPEESSERDVSTKSEETERSIEPEEPIKSQEPEESSERDVSTKSEETERSIEPEEPIKGQEPEESSEMDESTKSQELEMPTGSDVEDSSDQVQESHDEIYEPWVREGLTRQSYVYRLMETVRSKYPEDVWETKLDEVTKSLENGESTMLDELIKYRETEISTEVDELTTSQETVVSTEPDEGGNSGQPQGSKMEAVEDEESAGTHLARLILKARKATDEGEQRAELLKHIFRDLATQSKKPQQVQEADAAGIRLDESDSAGVEERNEKGVESEGDGVSADVKGAPSTTDDTGSGSATKARDDGSADDTMKVAEPADTAQTKKKAANTAQKEEKPADTARPVLGMYVTIRNKVNGEFVERPQSSKPVLDWSVEYSINEMTDERARQIYKEIKTRRKKIHDNQDPAIRTREWHKMFGGKLPILSKKGREYRAGKTLKEAGNPVQVVWTKEPLSPESLGINNSVSGAGGEEKS